MKNKQANGRAKSAEIPTVEILKKKFETEIGQWAKKIEKLPLFKVYTEHDFVLRDTASGADSLFECDFPITTSEVIRRLAWEDEVDVSGSANFKVNNRASITNGEKMFIARGEQPLLTQFEGTWAEVYERLVNLARKFQDFGIPKVPT